MHVVGRSAEGAPRIGHVDARGACGRGRGGLEVGGHLGCDAVHDAAHGHARRALTDTRVEDFAALALLREWCRIIRVDADYLLRAPGEVRVRAGQWEAR